MTRCSSGNRLLVDIKISLTVIMSLATHAEIGPIRDFFFFFFRPVLLKKNDDFRKI